ncbi:MAG TPA: hypothetical protein VFA98_05075 [Thermoanaerobaculia bacterium]|jgi:hypothetical protein|nr:hypothetical protein [Thermoanaerobaculia bacterium]
MAVLSSTATTTPIIGQETDVVSIAPGTPLDNITVYFKGGRFGGGGAIGLALYAVVGGFRTRVAQADVQGDGNGSIVEFQTIGRGDSETEEVDAGGTTYVVTCIDKSNVAPSPAVPIREPITVTLAGVDEFDTAADQNFGSAYGPLGPGASFTLPTMNGFAQLMDVAIDQTFLPGVTVSVVADCGPGSVAAVATSAQLAGRDQTIAAVFRGLKLPVATRYFVSVANASAQNVSGVLTAVTYSVSITAGGVVVLNGDVIGPSNANTVIKWDNVPLQLGAAPGFGAPVDAAIPIFDAGTGTWRTFALSGGATMTNAGVVTVNAAAITLGGDVTGPASANTVVAWRNKPLDPVTMAAPNVNDVPQWNGALWVAVPPPAAALVGNANGPSGANTVQWFTTSTTDANVNVGAQPHPTGLIYEGLNGLTADRTVTLNAAPVAGDEVTVKDEDGSLATHNIIINGNGKNIDGAATYTMTLAQNGLFGSVSMIYTGTAWALV